MHSKTQIHTLLYCRLLDVDKGILIRAYFKIVKTLLETKKLSWTVI